MCNTSSSLLPLLLLVGTSSSSHQRQQEFCFRNFLLLLDNDVRACSAFTYIGGYAPYSPLNDLRMFSHRITKLRPSTFLESVVNFDVVCRLQSCLLAKFLHATDKLAR